MTKATRRFLTVLLAAITFATVSLNAQTYKELYNFNWHSEGANPNNPALLAQGQDGNLYGTLQTTLSGDGSVFGWSIPASTVAKIYGFSGPDGSTPQSGLTLGLDGSFYGTTETGGIYGKGSVFKISLGGVLNQLYSFTDGTDSAYPWTPPIQGTDGSIYGTTYNGTNPGRAYKITAAGVFSVIAVLPSKTQAPLIFANDGNLYGTTPYGGTYNRGTVFKLTTKGVLTIIHSFTAELPGGPVMQAADGKLYGTTPWGGTNGEGTIYSMSLSGGSFKVLHNFLASEANNSIAGLVQGSDKFLYGVAQAGGPNGQGSLFRINTTGTVFSVLYGFQSALGDAPMSTPVLHTNGIIYGTTNHGGPVNSAYGTLYSFDNKLKPFASLVIIWSGKVGTEVGIIGQGFTTATGVKFGTGPGTFTLVSDTYMIASPATGATTGAVTILEPGGNLVTPQTFKVLPTISSISPTSGPVGTSVTFTGTSLSQASAVTFGGLKATFTINSDTSVTAVVPTGAITDKPHITTKGGTAASPTNFTVQ
jgi:uncharacterized repeat protein (TIGR03803 family)